LTLHRSGGITLAPKMECTDAELLTIGELARLTGLPVKRIHYYERRGLLEPTSRSKAGYRLYGREEVARLEFIKRAKLLGLTLEEIRELVELAATADFSVIDPYRMMRTSGSAEKSTRPIVHAWCAGQYQRNPLYSPNCG
jgi:DNA-binding transcriptional MerR regulator